MQDRTLTVVPIFSVRSVTDSQHLRRNLASKDLRKVLPCSNEIVELTDRLLGVVTSTAVHVTIEDASTMSNLGTE